MMTEFTFLFFSVNYLFSMVCISKKYYKILASVYICG